jgi:hypothetical protein
MLYQRLEILKALVLVADWQAKAPQIVQGLPLAAEGWAPFQVYHLVAKETQGPGGCDRRVEDSQTASRGVARIGIGLSPGSCLGAIECLKCLDRHVCLTTYNEPRWRHEARPLGDLYWPFGRGRRGDAQGQRSNRSEVGGDVLAANAIPSGCAQREGSFIVVEHDSQTIDLGLDDIGWLPVALGQQAQEAVSPSPKVVRVEGIAQAEHGVRMLDGGKFLPNLTTNPLRWGIGRHQLGMSRFQFLQFAEKSVVGAITDDRVVEDVVPVTVIAKLLS